MPTKLWKIWLSGVVPDWVRKAWPVREDQVIYSAGVLPDFAISKVRTYYQIPDNIALSAEFVGDVVLI